MIWTLIVPPLSPKSGFLTNLGQGLSQGFFQQTVRPGFVDKMKEKPYLSFVLVSSFLAVVQGVPQKYSGLPNNQATAFCSIA